MTSHPPISLQDLADDDWLRGYTQMLFTAESHEEVFLSVKHLLAVQSGALQRLAELAEEVSHIAKAERFNREKFGDDTAYADWVQSRCRFVLSARAPSAKEGKS